MMIVLLLLFIVSTPQSSSCPSQHLITINIQDYLLQNYLVAALIATCPTHSHMLTLADIAFNCSGTGQKLRYSFTAFVDHPLALL